MTRNLDLALRLGGDMAQTALRETRRDLRAVGQAANEAGVAAGRSAAGFGAAGVAARRAAVQQRGLRCAMQSSRASIRNTAFQVQDFAVRVAAGTSATRALGQQLPQLPGGFGPLGAVIGAVVAVGLPLAGMLFDTGDAADEAGKATDRLRGLRGLRDLRDDLDSVREACGAVTAQVRGLIRAQEEQARREAERAARTQVQGILSNVPGGVFITQDLVAVTQRARQALEKQGVVPGNLGHHGRGGARQPA